MPNATIIRNINNALIFCSSLVLTDQLLKKYGPYYYEIVDPFQFAKIIWDELGKGVPLLDYRCRKVSYANKEISLTNDNRTQVLSNLNIDPWKGYFLKTPESEDDREFRMVFVHAQELHIHDHRDVTSKKLLNC